MDKETLRSLLRPYGVEALRLYPTADRPDFMFSQLNAKQKSTMPSRYGAFCICPATKRGPTAGRGVFGGSSPPNPRSRGRLPLHPHSAMMIGRLSEIFPRETLDYVGYGHVPRGRKQFSE